MRGRFFFAAFVVLAWGCPGDGAGPEEPAGRLSLDRTEPDREKLIDARAHVRYCERDSVMSIASTEGDWIAAIALRTGWPPRDRFSVDSTSSGPGTAAVAIRPVGDSIGVAFIAQSGTVTLDTGAMLSGTIDAQAHRERDTLLIHLQGRFEAPRADTACGVP